MLGPDPGSTVGQFWTDSGLRYKQQGCASVRLTWRHGPDWHGTVAAVSGQRWAVGGQQRSAVGDRRRLAVGGACVQRPLVGGAWCQWHDQVAWLFIVTFLLSPLRHSALTRRLAFLLLSIHVCLRGYPSSRVASIILWTSTESNIFLMSHMSW